MWVAGGRIIGYKTKLESVSEECKKNHFETHAENAAVTKQTVTKQSIFPNK